ncbi:secretory pathway protein Sec39 [Schizosaccharomyces cryophilus OY26]|uniref:Secretory pathway protein Sec39 n=1 Tax=Schizosaccharomyces cryophilus (strain OY26 / ATCC MYA-4695 / CBS 11777 / NBRC 106824 / NRRL Y48691) TaxID=653667 RepID=S9X5S6_SCHCR|nr:secretory pathway protein Sec39 [Schizosaccharomyces cryophilus OY26]EPY52427.1 secretory pathway protein Sec39 [Schizosaccharomyces cryophilus OY26]
MEEEEVGPRWYKLLAKSQKTYLLLYLITNANLSEAKYVYGSLSLTLENWLSLLVKFLPETTEPALYIPYIDIDTDQGQVCNSLDVASTVKLPSDKLCQYRLRRMGLWECSLPSIQNVSQFYSIFSRKIVEETNQVHLAYLLMKSSQAPSEIREWSSGRFEVFHRLSQFTSVPVDLDEMEKASIRDVISLAFPILSIENCVAIMSEVILPFVLATESESDDAYTSWSYVWEKLLQLVKTDGLEILHELLVHWNIDDFTLRLLLMKVALSSLYICNETTTTTLSLGKEMLANIQEKLKLSPAPYGNLLKEPVKNSIDFFLSYSTDLTNPSSESVTLLYRIIDAIPILKSANMFPIPNVRACLNISASDKQSQESFLQKYLSSSLGESKTVSYNDWNKCFSFIISFKSQDLFFNKIESKEISLLFLKKILSVSNFSVLDKMKDQLALPDIDQDSLQNCMETSFYENFHSASSMNKNRGKLNAASRVLDVFSECDSLTTIRRRLYALINSVDLIKQFDFLIEKGKPLSPKQIEDNLDPNKLLAYIITQDSHSYQQVDELMALMIELYKASGEFNYNDVITQLRQITEQVVNRCVDAALLKSDMLTAKQLVEDRLVTLAELSDSMRERIYRICFKIGKTPLNDPQSREIRLEMLQLAIANAPKELLNDVVNYWTEFESNRDKEETESDLGADAFPELNESINDEELHGDDFDKEWSLAAAEVDSPTEDGVDVNYNESNLTALPNPDFSDNDEEDITKKVTNTFTSGLGWVLGIPQE